MTDFTLIQRLNRRLRCWVKSWRYRTSAWFKRLSRAWRYSTDHLTADDAQLVTLDFSDPAGWHPLLVLTVEDTLEEAREIFADHPNLPDLIARGCARVGYKWEMYGDELYEARRWAIDLADGYAADAGITLVRRDDRAGDADDDGRAA